MKMNFYEAMAVKVNIITASCLSEWGGCGEARAASLLMRHKHTASAHQRDSGGPIQIFLCLIVVFLFSRRNNAVCVCATAAQPVLFEFLPQTHSN